MFRMILNRSGSSPITGRTLSATGLYFFLVARLLCRKVFPFSGFCAAVLLLSVVSLLIGVALSATRLGVELFLCVSALLTSGVVPRLDASPFTGFIWSLGAITENGRRGIGSE